MPDTNNIQMSQNDLMNLISLAKTQTPAVTKLNTQYVIEAFYKNKRRHARSLERYNQIFREFTAMYPELPTESTPIDAFLSTIKGSDSNLATYYSIIRALYTFAFENLNYTDAMAKMHAPKIRHTEYKLRTPQELTAIFNAARAGREIALLCVTLDSTCRIGALGAHETLPGVFYKGLNITDLQQAGFTAPSEKTGVRYYSCLPEIIELMQQIANEDGYIFHNERQPTSRVCTSKDLSKIFTNIVKKAGVTGTKLGPHSFRHLGGSTIARFTKSALMVKAKLGHDEINTSMKYITEIEKDISQDVSPLKLLGGNIDQILRKPQPEPKQNHLMITDGTGNIVTSTELVPADQTEVETVEAIIDVSEQMFPIIPNLATPIRPMLNSKTLSLIRKVSVYYAKYAPMDGTSGELSSLMKSWLSKVKSYNKEVTND